MHNELIIIMIFGGHYYDSKSPHLQPLFKTLYLYALTNINCEAFFSQGFKNQATS